MAASSANTDSAGMVVITVRFPVPCIGAVVRLRPCNPNLSTGIFWVGVGDLRVCPAWRSGKRSAQVRTDTLVHNHDKCTDYRLTILTKLTPYTPPPAKA